MAAALEQGNIVADALYDAMRPRVSRVGDDDGNLRRFRVRRRGNFPATAIHGDDCGLRWWGGGDLDFHRFHLGRYYLFDKHMTCGRAGLIGGFRLSGFATKQAQC